jgi:hypothetical protein
VPQHRAGEQLELVRRGRGADENELVGTWIGTVPVS